MKTIRRGLEYVGQGQESETRVTRKQFQSDTSSAVAKSSTSTSPSPTHRCLQQHSALRCLAPFSRLGVITILVLPARNASPDEQQRRHLAHIQISVLSVQVASYLGGHTSRSWIQRVSFLPINHCNAARNIHFAPQGSFSLIQLCNRRWKPAHCFKGAVAECIFDHHKTATGSLEVIPTARQSTLVPQCGVFSNRG